jgi:hypothetical protein
MANEPVHPQLDETQRALVVALEEACAADLSKLDTGELIRIEETLEVASKAAKEAVSMRLRLGSQSGRASGTAPAASKPAADASAAIPHRVFEDDTGKRWHAFAVQAATAMSGRAGLPTAFQNGWLAFDSADEVRRLAPIPEGWVHLPVAELRLLFQRAVGAPKRASSTEGFHGPQSPITM